jgi:hypothetical protein
MSNLPEDLERALAHIKSLKSKYKDGWEFEYVFSATLVEKGSTEALVAEAYNFDDPLRLTNHIVALQKQLRFSKEIQRFEMLRRFTTCRVVCIDDILPPTLEPKGVQLNQWVKKMEPYRLVGMSADNTKHILSLHLETISGEKIIPPLPYDGFDSRRFILDDYSKLN